MKPATAFLCALIALLMTTAAFASPAPPPKPTTAIESGKCSTSECHPDIMAQPVVHGPVAAQTCDACHWLVSAEQHTFEPTREKADLCTYCHEFSTGQLPVVHQPVMAGECLGCHNPHGGADRAYMREATMSETCGACHDSVTRGRDFLHDPTAKDACNSCHRPHASRYPMLLDAVGQELCSACHDKFDEQLADASFRHDALDEGCNACHDPHGSDNPFGITEDVFDLCLSCHPDVRDRTDAMKAHPVVRSGSSCLVCHTPHGGNMASLLCDTPQQVCMGCHREDAESKKDSDLAHIEDASWFSHTPVRDGRCGDCHDIHGGDRAGLLVEPLSGEFYESFDAEKYALCFDCHDERMVASVEAGDSTKFRNGDRNLHYIHVTEGDFGRNCRVCHGVHSAKYPSLVRDVVPFGNWPMKTVFMPTPTGATCMTGCHPQRGYDRDVPLAVTDIAAPARKEPSVPPADPREGVSTCFEAVTLDGGFVAVPDLAGRPSVVVFVRAGDARARQALDRVMQATEGAPPAERIVVFGGGDDALAAARAFVEEGHGGWLVVIDSTHALARPAGVQVWPATLVVDSDGMVLAHLTGAAPALASQVGGYLDLAVGAIDRVALAARLGTPSNVADGTASRAAWSVQLARRLVAEGKGDEALALFDRMPAGEELSAEGIALRGRALAMLDRWTEARRAVEQAFAADPSSRDAHYLMGMIHEHDGAWEKSAAAYRAAAAARR